MANTITDNRTLLFNGGDGTGGAPDDLGGTALTSADTSTYLEGSTSYTISATNSRLGILFDAGTAQDYSNNIFYLTVNCGVVGLLTSKATGGFTVRFCGATVTDWFEVYVGGTDSWPNSIQGGWVQFVVDITLARSTAVTNGWTGGTAPAATAIRYVGISALCSVMPKMADNVWLDTIHRLPSGTPGILVQGRNGGTTDWNSANILTQLGSGQMAFYASGAAYTISTPIQIGINDTTTHGFSDTNKIWLWDSNEFITNSLYKISALGNSGGTTSVKLGVKTGSGDSASGSQGFTIAAPSSGVRWDMDFDDANLNTSGFYGCSFQHGGDFQLDHSSVECINTTYVDCQTATVNNSLQQKVSVITAATADGVAFMKTDDLADIKQSTFQFSDGHAIELTGAAASYTLAGCSFTGYGADTTNDAALYVSASSGAFTVNVGTATTYRAAGTTTVDIVLAPVTTQITVKNHLGSVLSGARVFLRAKDGTGDLPYNDSISITASGTTATVSHTAHGLKTGHQVLVKGAVETEYNGAFVITVTGANGYTYTMAGSPSSPATGSPLATGVLINEITTASGIADDTRSLSQAQPIKGYIRKATGSPRFKTYNIDDIVSSTTGFTSNVQLVLDE